MPTMAAAALQSLLIEPSSTDCGPHRLLLPANGSYQEEEDDDEDFFDPRESMSVASICGSDIEDRCGSRRRGERGSVSGCSEYYDAPEDLLSDGSFSNLSPSFSTRSNRELQDLRCKLIEEVERRKNIEMDLLHMDKQWERMTRCLEVLGLSHPEHGSVLMFDPAELCQEIIVTRYVCDAVERGLAREEAEAVAEEILDSKDHEISRLQDRVHYYEAVNHEMSQRNQEAVELARQRRTRRKTRRRLIWGCVGLTAAIGVSLLAFSYFPHSFKDPLPASSLDASSLSSETSVETEGCCAHD